MELPVYELTIDDFAEDRVEAIAFVDVPAIQRNWMAFNDQTKFEFSAVDTEKRIVAGPLMVADMPIYRNYQGKEFFVKFSAKTIEQIVDKFMAEGRINAFNYMHNEEQVISDVYLQQSFIIDSTKGINTPKGYEALADGSWFGFVKVNNDEIWNDFVKTGKLKGFSVEGNFSQKEQFNNIIMTDIKERIDLLYKKVFGSQGEQKNPVYNFAKLSDGQEAKWENELALGVSMLFSDDSILSDGEYAFDDGRTFTIKDGKIETIVTKNVETKMSAEDVIKISEQFMSTDPEISQLQQIVKFLIVENYGWQIREKEREANIEKVMSLASSFSTQIEEKLSKIEAPKDFSAEFVEFKKEVFEAMKEFIQSADESTKKDTFKKADAPLSKWELMAESKKK